MIIAIDGPGGAGKSSISDEVAKQLGFAHLDTGAMYRAVAYLVVERGIDVHDQDSCAEIAANDKIEFVLEPGNPAYKQILISGIDITDKIRTDEINKAVTPVCQHPKVREALVCQQQNIGKTGNYIVDGRDIGTVVFPDADVKIFLTADAHERAQRRVLQNEQTGHGSIDFDEVLEDINRRDFEDSNREVGPLMAADDSVVIDSTSMSFDEVVEEISALIKDNM